MNGSTKERLANAIEIAAKRGNAVNKFNEPLILAWWVVIFLAAATSVLMAATTPSFEGLDKPSNPVVRWLYAASLVMSAFSVPIQAFVYYEVFVLEKAMVRLKKDELKKAEALLKYSLLAPRGEDRD